MDKNLKIALILSAVDKSSAVLGKAFSRAEKQAKSLEQTGKGFSDVGDKAAIAGGVVTAFFGKTIADARESVITQNKLIQGFKTMGGSAKQAQDAIDFAGKKQFEWGVEDEEIMNVAGKMSTFSRVISDVAKQNDIFNRSTQAAFDMQAKGFGDAMGNITQLGKALQNPALGAAALAKSGAINKEDMPVIKYIQATKGMGAAQVFLMKAIEKQVKGTAAVTADPMKRMELQFREASESIGGILLPEVNKAADKIGRYVPKIVAFVNAHKPLVMAVARAGVALLAFGAAMKVIGFMFSGVSTIFKVAGSAIKTVNFIIANGGRVAALAAKGYEAFKFAAFAMQYHMKFSVIPALRGAGMAVVKFGATLLASPITWYILAAVALGAAVYFIIKNWDKISAFFARLWAGVKNVFSKFWDWAKFLFLNFTPYGLIIKHWDKIVPMFAAVWDKVKNVFTKAWDWVKGLAGKFADAGKNIVIAIAKGIWDASMLPVKAIMWIVKKVRGFLPFSPAKEGALKDIHKIKLVETIAQSITAKPLIKAMDNTTGELYNHMQGRAIPMHGNSTGGTTPVNINLTVNLSGSASQKDAAMLSDTVKNTMDKWWRDKQRNDARVAF
jgi:hypothetical protein